MPNNKPGSALTSLLERSPPAIFVLYAITVSFGTYFCMYAFRKPFAAAKYTDLHFFGIELKTALVISQILGYTLSKYIGIKVCSEADRARRAWTLIFLVVCSEIALVLFAVMPPTWKVGAIFLNGLPLGMVWGLVVRYLEGRRTSELLLAGLSCSFILASGAVKDAGRFFMAGLQVSEWWMPAVTGLSFLPGFLLFVWLLNQLPPANEGDIAARAPRVTMRGRDRLAFVKQFWPGLSLLLLAYFFLTAYRDFRDNYGVEIFEALGYGNTPAIFTKTELPVAFMVMVILAALNLIKNNRRGLAGAFLVMIGGLVVMGGSTLLWDLGIISGALWMVLNGLGSYLAYVPYGSVLFDRLIATTRVAGTAVFAIYVADALGYTGSVFVQLYKDLGQAGLSRVDFFRQYTYCMAIIGAVLLICGCFYFLARSRENPATPGK